ncbi:MAG: SDR family oxidoreductase [Actinomycetota bacterium]
MWVLEHLLSLDGKVAIITGAASGLGAETARLLAMAGASVVVADKNRDGADAVAADIIAAGGRSASAFVDVVDETSIRDLVDWVGGRYGRLDVLDNNAGNVGPDMQLDLDVVNMDPAIWDRMFAVNARGSMQMAQHAIPLMVKSGGGSIINIAANAGTWGDARSTAYGSSKAAVIALTRYIAVQHLADNIRCNAIAPGMIRTDQAKNHVPPSVAAEIDQRQIRNGRPEDIAHVVLFLASELGSFVTGQLLRVDGGLGASSPMFPARAALLRESRTGGKPGAT